MGDLLLVWPLGLGALHPRRERFVGPKKLYKHLDYLLQENTVCVQSSQIPSKWAEENENAREGLERCFVVKSTAALAHTAPPEDLGLEFQHPHGGSEPPVTWSRGSHHLFLPLRASGTEWFFQGVLLWDETFLLGGKGKAH